MNPQPLTDYEIVGEFRFCDTTEYVVIGQRPQGYWEMHYVNAAGSILAYRAADVRERMLTITKRFLNDHAPAIIGNLIQSAEASALNRRTNQP
jgi:hypothetical protein